MVVTNAGASAVVQAQARARSASHEVKLAARDVRVFHGAKQALHGMSLDVVKNEVIAFIGPSGCGKSTLLRCFNRMNTRHRGRPLGALRRVAGAAARAVRGRCA